MNSYINQFLFKLINYINMITEPDNFLLQYHPAGIIKMILFLKCHLCNQTIFKENGPYHPYIDKMFNHLKSKLDLSQLQSYLIKAWATVINDENAPDEIKQNINKLESPPYDKKNVRYFDFNPILFEINFCLKLLNEIIKSNEDFCSRSPSKILNTVCIQTNTMLLFRRRNC